MWKSLFLAVGTFMIILGVETLLVDKFVMADGRRIPRLVNGNSTPFSSAGFSGPGRSFATAPRREVQTKDWLPWSLLAAGTITVMYTCSVYSKSSPAE